MNISWFEADLEKLLEPYLAKGMNQNPDSYRW